MTFTQRYDSPMGGILLAADEIGLTGVWFDGQKYFARDCPRSGQSGILPSSQRPNAGWMFTSPEESRTLCRR